MPTTNVYDAFIVAGNEVSSTYEGRHLTLEESILVHPLGGDGFVDKGDPVVIGNIVGVAFNDAAATTDMIAIDTEGIWGLVVLGTDQNGNIAVAIGDAIYINPITAVLSKDSTLVPFGEALNEVVSGVTTTVIAVKVHNCLSINQQQDKSYMVVSKGGNDTYGDGSFSNPYLTITEAFTNVTDDRRTIYVFPGEYAEAAMLTWPSINDVNLIGLDGLGNVAISAAGAANVITIHPTVADVEGYYLQNICIIAEDQNGLLVDNAHMVAKMNLYMDNVDFEQEGTGDSLHVDHAVTTQAIRIYAKAEEADVEGPVDISTTNAGDRFRFKGYNFTTTFTTSATAVASEITLKECGLLSAASLAGGDGAQKLNLIGCWLFDGTTYAVTGAVNSTHANVNLQLT